MIDVFSKEQRSSIMRRVRSKNTTPELKVRRLLHAEGYRFTLHSGGLPGKPDIVFSRRKIVIFVHGCFWHQHRQCKAADRPSSNTAYWQQKLARNIARDDAATVALEAAGWRVIVVWECMLKAKAIGALLESLKAQLGPTRVP